MNPLSWSDIFENAPGESWPGGWRFSPLEELHRPEHSGRDRIFFEALNRRGEIAHEPDSSWKLQLKIGPRSRIAVLADGLLIRAGRKRARLNTAENGVLTGELHGNFRPVLIERGTAPALPAVFRTRHGCAAFAITRLKKNRQRFCLVTGAGSPEAARQRAEELLNAEFPPPLYAGERCQMLNNTDEESGPLPVFALESLLGALRTPAGGLHSLWSASADFETETFSLNEIFPLTLAWTSINLEIARHLLDTTLDLIRSDGFLPSWAAADGRLDSLDAPFPLLIQSVEHWFEETGDTEWLRGALPRLIRHMQWMLRHYDPQNSRHPAWQTPQEALSPGLFRPGLSTPDLVTLLLDGLEALHRMSGRINLQLPVLIGRERERLAALLEAEYWNPETATYSRCDDRGVSCILRGLHEFMPLLLRGLAEERRVPLWHLLRTSLRDIGPGGGARTLTKTGNLSPPHTLLLLRLLATGPAPAAFSACAAEFWRTLRIQHRIAERKNRILPRDSALSAVILTLHGEQLRQLNRMPASIRRLRRFLLRLKIDRYDLLVLCCFLFTLFTLRILYAPQESLSAATLAGQAQTAFENGNLRQSVALCQQILQQDETHREARLLLANIALLSHQFDLAGELYQTLRRDDPDNPAFLIGEALTLHRQGRLAEARPLYDEFLLYYKGFFPATEALVVRILNEQPSRLPYYDLRLFFQDRFMMIL